MRGEKPSSIQKSTKVGKADLSLLLERMRQTFTKLKQAAHLPKQRNDNHSPIRKELLSQDPIILKSIAQYLDKEGIYNVKVKDIHKHLTDNL